MYLSLHCYNNRIQEEKKIIENYKIEAHTRRYGIMWWNGFYRTTAKRTLISIKSDFPFRKKNVDVKKAHIFYYHIDCMLGCRINCCHMYCICRHYIRHSLIHKSNVFPFFSLPLPLQLLRSMRPISLPIVCFLV